MSIVYRYLRELIAWPSEPKFSRIAAAAAAVQRRVLLAFLSAMSRKLCSCECIPVHMQGVEACLAYKS